MKTRAFSPGAALTTTIAVLALAIACGGSTDSSGLEGGGGGGGGDSGAADGSSTTPPGPNVDPLTSCSGPGTCELGGKGCCPRSCVEYAPVVAFRRGEAEAFRQATCKQPDPVTCPECPRSLDPNIQAFCEFGRCGVVDVRTHAISTCAKDSDCMLRFASCCQPCAGGASEQIIAVAKDDLQTLEGQLCTGEQACPKCLPVMPEGLKASCNRTTNHCEVDSK